MTKKENEFEFNPADDTVPMGCVYASPERMINGAESIFSDRIYPNTHTVPDNSEDDLMFNEIYGSPEMMGRGDN